VHFNESISAFWRKEVPQSSGKKRIRSYNMPVNYQTTRHNMQEDCNIQSPPLESYIAHTVYKTKLHGLSPRATAACRRSDCQLVRIEGAKWSAWRIPPAVFSRFSRQEQLLFYQVAPQLYSRGWVDPVPDPLLFFFFGSAGNWTRASGSVAKNSDH
jgi:hypothetical protein